MVSRCLKVLFPSLAAREITTKLMQPEIGWEPVIGIADITGFPPKFVSAKQERDRLMIRFFRNRDDGTLRGKVWFGSLCEGPPGSAHGGSVAAVLDEAMGQAGWIAGYQVVAAKIEVQFRKKVPLETIYHLSASVTQVEGRKVFIKGSLLTPEGERLAHSSGLFVILRPEERFSNTASPNRPLT